MLSRTHENLHPQNITFFTFWLSIIHFCFKWSARDYGIFERQHHLLDPGDVARR